MSSYAELPPLESSATLPDAEASSAAHPLPREIRVPSGLLEELRTLAGAETLESAGRQAGAWLGAAMAQALSTEDLEQAPTQAFWDALDETLRSRGWGGLRQERAHSGLGVLVAEDWMETGSASSPGCPFTVGLLTALFEKVAGAPVAVLETACQGHGQDTCRFVFGSPAAVAELRSRLEAGASEETALAGF